MKFLKFVFKLAVAFLTFGAIASLYLSKNNDEYIHITQDENNLY